MKKRFVAALVAISLVLTALVTVLVVRLVKKSPPPDLESLRPRIIGLIDASKEVNEILWGEGLPTYPRVYQTEPDYLSYYLTRKDGDLIYSEEQTALQLLYYVIEDETEGTVIAYRYCLRETVGEKDYIYTDVEKNIPLTSVEVGRFRYAKKTTVAGDNAVFEKDGYYYYALPAYEEKEAEFYYDEKDEPYYDYVREDADCITIAAIKDKAEKVYAMTYLSSLYESIFTGINVSEESSGTLYARYIDYTDRDGNSWLLKSNTQKPKNVNRVYHYDTMRYSEEKKSTSTYVYVEMETHLEGSDEITTVRLSFALQDGAWYLDAPSY